MRHRQETLRLKKRVLSKETGRADKPGALFSRIVRKSLLDELEELWSPDDCGGDKVTLVSSEYLEVVAVTF